MSQPGLSPDTFIERVQDAGSVVDQWPFAHMLDHEHFIGQHDVVRISPIDNEERRALVVGRVGVLFGDTVWMNSLDYSGGYSERLNLLMRSDEEAAAWSQMAGARASLEIDLVPRDAARNTRIRGIEQPIYPPNENGGFVNKRAARDEGFIQGTVEADVPDLQGAHIRLAIGRSLGSAFVSVQSPFATAPNEGRHRTSLDAGDQVRIPVKRDGNYNPDYFYIRGYTFILPGRPSEK